MMSVTTLRNIKKLLKEFIYENHKNTISKYYKKKKLLEEKVVREIPLYYHIPSQSNISFIDGYASIMFKPEKAPAYKELLNLDNKIRKENEKTNQTLRTVERYFTLSEASNVLNIPEMPKEIKKLLDEMVKSVK